MTITMDITIKFLRILILSISLSSCGESPFLDDSPSNYNKETNGSFELNSELVFSNLNLNAQIIWKAPPQLYRLESLIVMFKNDDAITVDPPYEFKAKLWMPDHGHGSRPIKVHKLSTGVYELNELVFTMEGYWDLHLQILNPNKEKPEEVLLGIEF